MLKGRSLVGDSVSKDRVALDYYATPPYATAEFLDLLERDGLSLEGTILEPACGEGHMSEVLKEYYGDVVTSTDIVDRGYKDFAGAYDFIKDEFKMYDNVITNPPFKYAQEFVEKGLEVARSKVVIFAKIQFLEGVRRSELFEATPPNYIYVHSRRVAPYRNGEEFNEDGKPWGSTMCFAWFIWEHGNSHEPIVRWVV